MAVFLLLAGGIFEIAEARPAAAPDSLAPQGMYSPVTIALALLTAEGILAAGSALTRYRIGAYAVGGFHGINAFTLALNTFFETENAYPRLIMAGGLGYLSYYNLHFHNQHSNSRKFWTNFIGVNATAATALLVYIAIPDRGFNLFQADNSQIGAGLDIYLTATGIGMQLSF